MSATQQNTIQLRCNPTTSPNKTTDTSSGAAGNLIIAASTPEVGADIGIALGTTILSYFHYIVEISKTPCTASVSKLPQARRRCRFWRI
jgi:hypothetical protein